MVRLLDGELAGSHDTRLIWVVVWWWYGSVEHPHGVMWCCYVTGQKWCCYVTGQKN